jgi:hypothetical protein
MSVLLSYDSQAEVCCYFYAVTPFGLTSTMLGKQSDDRSNLQLTAQFECDVHEINLHCSTTIFQLLLFSCTAGFP